MLVMDQYPPEQIKGIKKCFNLYIKFQKIDGKKLKELKKTTKKEIKYMTF